MHKVKKIFISFAIIFAAGAAWLLLKPNSKPETPQPATVSSEVTKSEAGALILGQPSAKLTIVSYGDFQCPRCNKFFTTIEPRIREEYLDKGLVKIEWRNFATIGQESVDAAQAAHCANDQQFFPQFYSAVFNYMNANYWAKGINGENVGALSRSQLNKLAESSYDLINVAQFSKCLNEGKYAPKVKQELEAAQSAGFSLNTYVVGNQVINGVQPYAIFRPVIQSQL